ncbi:hypothetical protein [Listeria riparia]|uniref:Putative transposase n=1 Tax=Listeria riparia FSL S10-1204 TaxID=1265816 RepID=W7D891_9LIST|nr:hypothetical protein [Listeria riparia]EUJ45357.1 putative transposase [Listeria riparia FSL S10-1204]
MYINYNMDQLIFPMDLETMIPEDHVLRIYLPGYLLKNEFDYKRLY